MFGASRGAKLRAAGDLKQSWANRAAHVLTTRNLPTSGHFSSLTKFVIDHTPDSPFGFADADHSDAYNQVLLRPQNGELSVATHRDLGSGDWKAVLPNTQLFGLTTAVLKY